MPQRVIPLRYAELVCRSNFSFLVGGSHPDELVGRAAELGYAALAITDFDSLAGVVKAHQAARETGLRLIVGAELTPRDAPAMVAWAMDRHGYANLCRIITAGRRRAPKGQSALEFADIVERHAGLLFGLRPDVSDDRPVTSADLAKNATAAFPRSVNHKDCRDLFGNRAYLLASLYRGVDDRRRLAELKRLAAAIGLPLVATGDVLYHTRERMPLHDVLTAIRLGAPVDQIRDQLEPNADRHLQEIPERVAQFLDAPEAIAATLEIADRCRFELAQLRYEYPTELAPGGQRPIDYLRRLTWEGAAWRYPAEVSEKVQRALEHELALIEEMHYEAYFLTVWDLVRFARSRGILCQGRGSAANSAVCYCLGVTSVNPDTTDLLFERFISKERNEAPDIDIDFEHERREEVLQYLYDKYGRDRAGLAATVITYRARSAIRDVGKALGLSLDRVDALAKQIDGYGHGDDLPERCRAVGIDPQSPLGRQLCHLVDELQGFPRHLSQHVGGMVMTQGRLDELVPIENAAMDGRTVIQWDKEDLESLGLLKVDCLCLGMLTAIRKCFELIERHTGRSLSLATIPPEDFRVYDMICEADTVGVFQIESRGQMSMLPRLKPRCWYDLVIEVAIVRPGPIQGNMVHPYLRRRNGEESVVYPNEAIRQVLQRTLGVPIFQEQAMKLAIVAAGFTPGEADQLRRAMGAWRKSGVIEKFREKLLTGMRERGLSDEFAEQVFRQIRGFGEYGFPESHAASFALLVYVSGWLKRYYPAAFTASLLNSQPMGFYAPAQLVADAQRHGVEVYPPDVNYSDWDSTLEPQPGIDSAWGLRLGLRQIAGLGAEAGRRIVASREELGPFFSITEFGVRTGLGQAVIAQLSQADAFASLQQDRRAALWQALGQPRRPIDQPLFAGLPCEDDPAADRLPPVELSDQVLADYRALGLSLKAHPLSFCRPRLTSLGAIAAAGMSAVANLRPVRVAGLVILRQRPSTAKGITFVTLEDETGTVNLIVKPQIWERFYQTCRTSPAWLVSGRLETCSGVTHVIAERIEDLHQQLQLPNVKSRDFR